MNGSDPRILAFAGSIRKGSVNRRLLQHAAGAVGAHGMTVTLVDLADYPMPLMHQDLEAEHGMPEPAAWAASAQTSASPTRKPVKRACRYGKRAEILGTSGFI